MKCNGFIGFINALLDNSPELRKHFNDAVESHIESMFENLRRVDSIFAGWEKWNNRLAWTQNTKQQKKRTPTPVLIVNKYERQFTGFVFAIGGSKK